MKRDLKKSFRKREALNDIHNDLVEKQWIEDDIIRFDWFRGEHAFEGSYDSHNADEWFLEINLDLVHSYFEENNILNLDIGEGVISGNMISYFVKFSDLNFYCKHRVIELVNKLEYERLERFFSLVLSFTSKKWNDRDVPDLKVSICDTFSSNQYSIYLYDLEQILSKKFEADYIQSLTDKVLSLYISRNARILKMQDITEEEFLKNYPLYLETQEMLEY